MAVLRMELFSSALGLNVGVNVILPQKGEDIPTLYLLHGYSDSYTAWQRYTGIERYASRYKLAVVMPDAQKSFYTNFQGITRSYAYWTYISEELPEIMRNMFRLSRKREDTFVAGLSMGGFGAFKCALNKPDVFSHGASLSGAVDAVQVAINWEEENEFNLIMTPSAVKGSENDLMHKATLADALPPDQKPRLYQCCGTEDFLYEDNIRFREHINGLNFDYTYEEGPGTHEWGFWDMYIQRVLEWLPLEKVSHESK